MSIISIYVASALFELTDIIFRSFYRSLLLEGNLKLEIQSKTLTVLSHLNHIPDLWFVFLFIMFTYHGTLFVYFHHILTSGKSVTVGSTQRSLLVGHRELTVCQGLNSDQPYAREAPYMLYSSPSFPPFLLNYIFVFPSSWLLCYSSHRTDLRILVKRTKLLPPRSVFVS